MVRSEVARVREHRTSGFSLVELIVAIVILSMGVLSMVGTSSWVVRQVTLSRLSTERASARQSAIEGVMAGPYASMAAGSGTFGIFDVTWAVTADVSSFRTLRVVTVGPGRAPGTAGMTTLSSDLADTIFVTIPSPGF